MNMYKYRYKYKENNELYDKLVRIHLVLNNINLTEQQIQILIYFCMFGVQDTTYSKLITDNVVTSKQIINNAKTQLRKLNLIEMKSYKNWKVNNYLSQEINNEIQFIISCKI